MTVQRPINIISVETICDLYGTDATQFDSGTLALVRQEGAYFAVVDSGGAPGPDLVSTTNGPQQPGCTNPNVDVGTSPLRWARTSLTIAEAMRGNAPAYFVNAVTGDNSLDGLTPDTAVEQVAEVCRRMKGAAYNTTAIHIYCLTPIPSSDTAFFERNVTPGLPIIVHSQLDAPAPYKLTPAASYTLTAVDDLDPAANQEQRITALALGAVPLSPPSVLVLSPTSSNPGAFAWPAAALSPTELRTTPFGEQTGLSPVVTLQDPIVADVVEAYVAPSFMLSALRLDIDPDAEVWFKGFNVRGGPSVPQRIVSGVLRLVQCTGQDLDLKCFGDASLAFNACHTYAITGSVRGSGTFEAETTFFLGDAPLARTRRIAAHCMIDPDATITVAAQQEFGIDSCYTEFEDLCIVAQANGDGAFAADLGGFVSLSGFLYGSDVATYAGTLDHFSQAVYKAILPSQPPVVNPTGISFVAAETASYPGSAKVKFPRSAGPAVEKTLTTDDLPFVSIATAVDSQSGLIELPWARSLKPPRPGPGGFRRSPRSSARRCP